MDVFEDPLISTSGPSGAARVTLGAMLAMAEAGVLDDLPAARPHQRHILVTAFGILLHLVRRYGNGAVTPGTLQEIVGREGFADAGRLYTRIDERAFLQAALPGWPAGKPRHYEEADLLFTGIAHETHVNSHGRGGHEQALFALIAGSDRIGVMWNGSGPRWGLLTVVPSDGTIGSEIRSVADGYDEGRLNDPAEWTGVKWRPAKQMSDHLPWLRPWTFGLEIGPADMAWPMLDLCRPTRLALNGDAPGCIYHPGKYRRVKKGIELLFDPHTARNDTKPIRLVKARDKLTVGAITLVTVGLSPAPKKSGKPKEAVTPALTSFSGDQPLLRISGVAYDNGRTLGFHDLLVRRPSVMHGSDERRTFLAEALREHIKKVRTALEEALRFAKLPFEEACTRFDRAAAPHGLNWVVKQSAVSAADGEAFAMRKTEAGEVEERFDADTLSCSRLLLGLALPILRSELRNAWIGNVPSLTLAAAEATFTSILGRARMPTEPHLADAKQALAEPHPERVMMAKALAAISGHMMAPDGEIARSLRSSPPGGAVMAVCSLLALPSVPRDWERMRFWDRLLPAMARVPHSTGKTSQRIGRAMALRQVPETRVIRMLDAQGAMVAEHVSSMVMVMEAGSRSPIQWTDLAVMLLAVEKKDRDLLADARRTIALDYHRAA